MVGFAVQGTSGLEESCESLQATDVETFCKAYETPKSKTLERQILKHPSRPKKPNAGSNLAEDSLHSVEPVSNRQKDVLCRKNPSGTAFKP